MSEQTIHPITAWLNKNADWTQLRLAEAVGVTQGQISQWVTCRRPIPIKQCVAIETVTGGFVTRKELRPSDWFLYWPELKEPTQ